MAISDKSLTCIECGCEFTFTVGEQEFFVSKGFTIKPSRCLQCRAALKNQQRDAAGLDLPGPPPEMYPAVCA